MAAEPVPAGPESVPVVAEPTSALAELAQLLTAQPPVAAAPAPVVPAQSATPDPLTPPRAVANERVAPALATRPIGWPCVRCNISVPIEEDICPECGSRFLDAPLGEQAGLVDRLPNLSGNKPMYAGILVGGSLALTVVFLALLALFGLIF